MTNSSISTSVNSSMSKNSCNSNNSKQHQLQNNQLHRSSTVSSSSNHAGTTATDHQDHYLLLLSKQQQVSDKENIPLVVAPTKPPPPQDKESKTDTRDENGTNPTICTSSSRKHGGQQEEQQTTTTTTTALKLSKHNHHHHKNNKNQSNSSSQSKNSQRRKSASPKRRKAGSLLLHLHDDDDDDEEDDFDDSNEQTVNSNNGDVDDDLWKQMQAKSPTTSAAAAAAIPAAASAAADPKSWWKLVYGSTTGMPPLPPGTTTWSARRPPPPRSCMSSTKKRPRSNSPNHTSIFDTTTIPTHDLMTPLGSTRQAGTPLSSRIPPPLFPPCAAPAVASTTTAVSCDAVSAVPATKHAAAQSIASADSNTNTTTSNNTTPLRMVKFGPSSAVEFDAHSPARSMTPLPPQIAAKAFPSDEPLVEEEELELDRVTKENTAMLLQWEQQLNNDGSDSDNSDDDDDDDDDCSDDTVENYVSLVKDDNGDDAVVQTTTVHRRRRSSTNQAANNIKLPVCLSLCNRKRDRRSSSLFRPKNGRASLLEDDDEEVPNGDDENDDDDDENDGDSQINLLEINSVDTDKEIGAEECPGALQMETEGDSSSVPICSAIQETDEACAVLQNEGYFSSSLAAVNCHVSSIPGSDKPETTKLISNFVDGLANDKETEDHQSILSSPSMVANEDSEIRHKAIKRMASLEETTQMCLMYLETETSLSEDQFISSPPPMLAQGKAKCHGQGADVNGKPCTISNKNSVLSPSSIGLVDLSVHSPPTQSFQRSEGNSEAGFVTTHAQQNNQYDLEQAWQNCKTIISNQEVSSWWKMMFEQEEEEVVDPDDVLASIATLNFETILKALAGSPLASSSSRREDDGGDDDDAEPSWIEYLLSESILEQELSSTAVHRLATASELVQSELSSALQEEEGLFALQQQAILLAQYEPDLYEEAYDNCYTMTEFAWETLELQVLESLAFHLENFVVGELADQLQLQMALPKGSNTSSTRRITSMLVQKETRAIQQLERHIQNHMQQQELVKHRMLQEEVWYWIEAALAATLTKKLAPFEMSDDSSSMTAAAAAAGDEESSLFFYTPMQGVRIQLRLHLNIKNQNNNSLNESVDVSYRDFDDDDDRILEAKLITSERNSAEDTMDAAAALGGEVDDADPILPSDSVGAEFYRAMVGKWISTYNDNFAQKSNAEWFGGQQQSEGLPRSLMMLEWMLGRLSIASEEWTSLSKQFPCAILAVEESKAAENEETATAAEGPHSCLLQNGNNLAPQNAVHVFVWVQSIIENRQRTATYQVTYGFDSRQPCSRRTMNWSLPSFIQIENENKNDGDAGTMNSSERVKPPNERVQTLLLEATTGQHHSSIQTCSSILSRLCQAILEVDGGEDVE